MRKAVLCFAHKDAKLLNVLIEQLLHQSPETDVYIHLDKKSEALKNDIMTHPHVLFIKQNVSVTWGDDSMMKALLNSWQAIYESGKEYDYFIMCTGQDLLVKRNLDDFLIANSGKIWLDATERNHIGQQSITHKFPRFICRDLIYLPRWHPLRVFRGLYRYLVHLGLLPKRKVQFPIRQLTLYFSYNWSIMPYEVFKYCHTFMIKNPDFAELYTKTFIPEDFFLASVIMNSPYAKNVVWGEQGWSKTQTFHYIVNPHPKILTCDDIPAIEASDCYFARKFDSNTDTRIIQYFKEKITNK